MSEICETVKIKDDKAPGGYVVVNAVDYDDKRHTLYVEKAVTKEAAPEKAPDHAPKAAGGKK